MAYHLRIKLCKYERILGIESTISTGGSLGAPMKESNPTTTPGSQARRLATENTAPCGGYWFSACTPEGLGN